MDGSHHRHLGAKVRGCLNMWREGSTEPPFPLLANKRSSDHLRTTSGLPPTADIQAPRLLSRRFRLLYPGEQANTRVWLNREKMDGSYLVEPLPTAVNRQ